jgi:hypothetical protein
VGVAVDHNGEVDGDRCDTSGAVDRLDPPTVDNPSLQSYFSSSQREVTDEAIPQPGPLCRARCALLSGGGPATRCRRRRVPNKSRPGIDSTGATIYVAPGTYAYHCLDDRRHRSCSLRRKDPSVRAPDSRCTLDGLVGR